MDATEFILLSVLTRDWTVKRFSKFSGQFCFLSVTSHRHLTLCIVCFRTRERFASHNPHDVVLTPELLLTRGLSGIVFWFGKVPEMVGAQIPHLVAKPSVADCGMKYECGSVESLGRVLEVTQRCMAVGRRQHA